MTHSGDAGIGEIIAFHDLDHTASSDEFVGAEHGDVPFSVILVDGGPGAGPRVHSHPYPEVFLVESGQATFRLGDREMVVEAGHLVVGPSNVLHGFVNSGPGQLRLIAIHGASRFDTRWLDGDDPGWTSRRRGTEGSP